MKKFTLKVADVGDIQEIQDLIYPHYFQETIYKNLDYDPVSTAHYIAQWVNDHCIIAKDENGKIVGVVSFYFINTYYKQKECDITIFYILPEFRGTELARTFVKYIVKGCEIRGDVGAIYTTSASGAEGKNNALYANLFKKHGFQDLGTELVRVFNE